VPGTVVPIRGGPLKDVERGIQNTSDVMGHRSRPYIEFKHVSISFRETPVLNDVSFSVLEGETVCILGRSGVGKSVSLRIIMGFLKPDSGRVITAQEDITNYSEEELQRVHRKVTMVFQNGALFDSLTVAENVAFPLIERGELNEKQIERSVDELLDLVGIKAMRDFLPPDIPTGMKRSVAIARALAAKPRAVLYDEPTTMVDPLMARRLTDVIKRLNRHLNLTSVVVTHDMRLVEELANHIIFLDRARIIFVGTVTEMEHSTEPLVQQFLELDRMDFRAMLKVIEPDHNMVR
jgi:phospholipid/cholesterol/gamma-HCH transport system ATP-binding protein